MNNKIRLSFYGDFVAPNVSKLKIGNELNRIISESDFNVLNFEAPVHSNGTPISKSGPNNDQCIDAPKWLEDHNFNIITLSNNHLFDFGYVGYSKTIESFKAAHLVGAGKWNEAYKPLVIESNGCKIAFLSLTHCEFGTLTDSFAKDTFGCAWINHPSVDGIINNVKKDVDCLIVLAHAGVEYLEQPLPEWRERYCSFIDLGCDAVIASHPHIPQGWEEYKGKPIFYSLGNFYFPQNKEKPWSWYRSLCVSIMLEKKKLSYEVLPLLFDDDTIDICQDSKINEYINRIQETLSDDNKYIEDINRSCEKLLPLYYNYFYKGGLVETRSKVLFLKRILKSFLRIESFRIEPLINNLRCESHRWCICRALKNKYDIK